MNTALYETYVQILHEELVPAMGCTEPIAVAYAGALARQTLGALPERIELTVSGNIIKNVKSVIVPHTGGRKGLPVAVAAGVRVGDADAQLEVLANVTEDLIAFADKVDLDDVRAPIARQIEYNTAIAEAGLTGQYGAAIGKILLDSYGDSVQNRAKAWAAAGSDARMNGCVMPVVINSGSGNQGKTASLPVIVYAREM